jgi:hypothetical protein
VKRVSRVFQPVSDHRNVLLNFQASPKSEFYFYVRPYHEAARTLARRAIERRAFRDLDALPIVFLYRHALELAVKAVIVHGNQRMALSGEGLPEERLWRTLTGHRLSTLLPLLRHVLDFVDWEWTWEDPAIGTFPDVCEVISQLEQIDPLSFAFRYPTDVRGNGSVPEGFQFSLFHFVHRIDPLVEAFDTAAFGLRAEYERATYALV